MTAAAKIPATALAASPGDRHGGLVSELISSHLTAHGESSRVADWMLAGTGRAC
jgi:hypothetical protein